MKRFKCDHCISREYYRKNSLNRHLETCHQIVNKSTKASPKFCCAHSDCNKRQFPTRDDYLLHCQQEHNVVVNTQTFNTIEEFRDWLTKIQIETKSKFWRRSGNENSVVQIFECNRSGEYRPKIKKDGKTHKKPSSYRKIGANCSAFIKCNRNDSNITVRFCLDHLGHELDWKFISHSKEDLNEFARRIKEGATVPKIINTFKSHEYIEKYGDSKTTRVNGQVLKNLKLRRRLNKRQLDENDMESVQLYVDKNPEEFLFFDREKVNVGIMTSTQQELLKLLGPKCIIMDDTCGIGPYDIQLTTVCVVNSDGNYFPVAFFLHPEEASRDMVLSFFNAIKQRLDGSLSTDIFMSDMARCYHSAWSEVMGQPKQKLVCIWHIMQKWIEHIPKNVSPDSAGKQVYDYFAFYGYLHLMAKSNNKQHFESTLSDFYKYLLDNEMKAFVGYFKRQYEKHATEWIGYMRSSTPVTTTNPLESMHGFLKREDLLLDGRKSDRLDNIIFILLDLTRKSAETIVNNLNLVHANMETIHQEHNYAYKQTYQDDEEYSCIQDYEDSNFESSRIIFENDQDENIVNNIGRYVTI